MKRLFAGLMLSGFILISCSTGPNNPVDNNSPGSANVSVRVGNVGTMAKRHDISLSKLIISISSQGETPILDTFPLSGNGQMTVSKTYNNLASLKTWTLSVNTLDSKDSLIHSGSTTFNIQPRQTTDVSLDLSARFSMLKANFFPIRDSVTRCELLVNGTNVDDSSFAKQSAIGNTVKLAYDYLQTNIAQRINMDVYGKMWGLDTLLYAGDTTITPLPGSNASYTITLKWVGLALPPPGQATMTVTLGAMGTVTVNGQIGVPAGITMINIPAGTFQMGSANQAFINAYWNGPTSVPIHSVTLSAFSMSQTLVTQAQYKSVMGTNPSFYDSGEVWPVEQVSWYDAVLFCNKLSKAEGLDTVYTYTGTGIYAYQGSNYDTLTSVGIDFTKNGYRLPTEAEWEYACRAGNTTDYYWGQNFSPLTAADTTQIGAHTVCWLNSPNSTRSVAMMPPNAWGLYDMEGNLMQLTNDVWSPYSANSQINPLATTSSGWGPGNVVRGGDFGNSTVINAMKLCAAFRSFCGPWQPLNYLGFRLVRGAH